MCRQMGRWFKEGGLQRLVGPGGGKCKGPEAGKSGHFETPRGGRRGEKWGRREAGSGAGGWSLGAHQECFRVCCARTVMGSRAVTVLETQALGGVWPRAGVTQLPSAHFTLEETDARRREAISPVPPAAPCSPLMPGCSLPPPNALMWASCGRGNCVPKGGTKEGGFTHTSPGLRPCPTVFSVLMAWFVQRAPRAGQGARTRKDGGPAGPWSQPADKGLHSEAPSSADQGPTPLTRPGDVTLGLTSPPPAAVLYGTS